ncbi:MAG: methylated-DNA--[protein]-cysteine S-methyltransferase [Treponema sp.]|nr:methylated-DNA--[protein]-cysteine S-methyltransferase [Treponema sp.]
MVPLAPQGSPFRQSVWNLLLKIPYGQTTTYSALAAQLTGGSNRSPLSARAVGGAVGHNPISLLIPCHRVIGAGGSLTGYAGGVDRKKTLLELEQKTAISTGGDGA